MIRISLLAPLLLAALALPAAGQTGDSEERYPPMAWRGDHWEEFDGIALADTLITLRVTTGNNLGLTIYNNGFIGTNLSDRSPSMEYPIRSGQEHLVRAGVWVGGIPASEVDTLVSTSTIDGYFGSFDARGVSEFYPVRSTIDERSILKRSCCYDRRAKSEQDFLTSFFDKRSHFQHTPLDIRVDLETLLFSFEPFDAIVIANYTIHNTNPIDPIFNVYVGLYGELATGYKDDQTSWPPSGWFNRKDIAYVDSLRLVTEHHFTLDEGDCPSWAGIQLLGTRPTPISEHDVSFNWWNWDPNFTLAGTPKNDRERYRMMANGAIDPTAGSEAPNNDPVTMLAVGPFTVIEPGDSIVVSFAFLGGHPTPREGRDAEADLLYNAGWAQTAFDLNFNIPVPPPSPALRVFPQHSKLTLRWRNDPEEFIDPKSHEMDFEGYRIYISERKEEEGFRLIRQVDVVDSLLENTGLESLRDSIVIGTDTLHYRFDIEGVRDGFNYWAAVTSFDTGTQEVPPLESGRSQNRTYAIPGGSPAPAGSVIVFPNPYRGDASWDGALARDRYLWFANLPNRCTIRIYTLAGDLVDTIEFDGSSYDATEIRGIFDPTDVKNPENDVPVLSGGMAAWDLITRSDQGVASGLYIFSVEDKQTGGTQLGKFLILK